MNFHKPGCQMPLHNAPENLQHSDVIKHSYCDRVKMSKEAWCNGITTTTRGTHSRYDLYIH